MVKAVDQLPIADDWASSLVHLSQDKMPTKKSRLANRGNYKKICHMLGQQSMPIGATKVRLNL